MLLGLVGALVGGVALTSAGQGTSTYEVAAEFDSAKGMVPGQLVKIAGTRVGKVEGVHLTPNRRARIRFTVDRRFAPFHADARCRILPEGLISENYIDCEPGAAAGEPLRVRDGIPTVPVTQTTTPVALQDVINIFSLPVDKRIQALAVELGLGTSGRGADVNAVLRRANPTLLNVRGLLDVVGRQRDELADAVRQTDGVLAAVAADDRSVDRFVSRAAAVTEVTARRAQPLQATVARLPALLRTAQTSLRRLDTATEAGAPLLDALRAAAPEAERLTTELPAFTTQASRALTALTPALRSGRVALRRARPAVRDLRTTMGTVEPAAAQLSRFMTSTRDTGGWDSFLGVLYTLANLSAAFDQTSHIITFFANVSGTCVADPTVPGCDHRYTAPAQGATPVPTGPPPPMDFTRGRAFLKALLG